MKCYLCLLETGRSDESACALCQHCGAAICQAHVRELRFSPIGAVARRGRALVKYSLICQRCSLATTPSAPVTFPAQEQA